jgi:hypothetical protein
VVRAEICEVDKKNLTACWAIDGGKIFIHFSSGLTELYNIRKAIDTMIEELETGKKEHDEEHKRSLRAKRAKGVRDKK